MFQMDCQKHFAKLQKMKNMESKAKLIKIGKRVEQHIDLSAKIIQRILDQKK